MPHLSDRREHDPGADQRADEPDEDRKPGGHGVGPGTANRASAPVMNAVATTEMTLPSINGG
jgi:hypothetical protein